MRRRILAWVLLIGFVLLFLNLIVFKVLWQLSMVIYLIIMFIFLFTNRRGPGYNKENEPDGSTDGREDGSGEDSGDGREDDSIDRSEDGMDNAGSDESDSSKEDADSSR